MKNVKEKQVETRTKDGRRRITPLLVSTMEVRCVVSFPVKTLDCCCSECSIVLYSEQFSPSFHPEVNVTNSTSYSVAAYLVVLTFPKVLNCAVIFPFA